MAISTIGSYLPTMQEFIAHWTQVNAALAPGALTLKGGYTLANFTTDRICQRGRIIARANHKRHGARNATDGSVTRIRRRYHQREIHSALRGRGEARIAHTLDDANDGRPWLSRANPNSFPKSVPPRSVTPVAYSETATHDYLRRYRSLQRGREEATREEPNAHRLEVSWGRDLNGMNGQLRVR